MPKPKSLPLALHQEFTILLINNLLVEYFSKIFVNMY